MKKRFSRFKNSISFVKKVFPLDVIKTSSIHVLHHEDDTTKYEGGNMYIKEQISIKKTNHRVIPVLELRITQAQLLAR